MSELLRSLRPRHWVKNLLIFIPGLLAEVFTDADKLLNAILGFIAFCLMASAGYILNDIRDIDKDRLHPHKRKRPLASASVKVGNVFILAVLLIIISATISFILGIKSLIIISTYFLLNWAYSVKLKQIRFLDIIILSGFYIIRLLYGSAITDTLLTDWFIITMTFACICLSLNKRHMECIVTTQNELPGRDYSKNDATLLQTLSVVFGIATLVFLNIHSSFILKINSPIPVALFNLIAACLLMVYFDHRNEKNDDPVEQVLKNPVIIILGVILLTIYTYEIWSRK